MAQDIRVALTLDNKQFNSALKQSEKNVKVLGTSTKGTTSSVTGLVGAFQAFIAIGAVKEIVKLADEFTSLTNRLKATATSEIAAANALKLVQQVASETRSDLSAVAGLFADITIASEDLGLSQERVAGIAKVFSQSLKISGADAGTAAGAIRQFGQALASGVLRGDEFNSINEANSVFMGELAKSLNITRGELRLMAQQGKITAEVMIEATENMADNVERNFGKTVGTIADSFTNLRNELVSALGDIGTESGGVNSLSGAIDQLAAAIKLLKPVISVITAIVGAFAALGIILLKFKVLSFVIAGFADSIWYTSKKSSQLVKMMRVLSSDSKHATAFLARQGFVVRSLGTIFMWFSKTLSQAAKVVKNFFSVAAWKIFFKNSLNPLKNLTKATFTWWGLLKGILKGVVAISKKFVAFFFIYDVIKLVVKATASLVDWFGRLIGLDFGFLANVTSMFDSLETAVWNATKSAFGFAFGWIKFKKELEDTKTDSVVDGIDEITEQLNLQLEAQRMLVEEAKRVKQSYDDFYKSLYEGARDSVDETNNVATAVEKLMMSGTRWSQPEIWAEMMKELGYNTDGVSLKVIELAKAAAEAGEALADIEKSISDDFGLSDIQLQLAEFDMSEVDKRVSALFRELDESFEDQKIDLTEFIKTEGLDADVKANAEKALAQLESKLGLAKLLGEEFVRNLFGKEQTKAFEDFQKLIANATSFEGLEALRGRLKELGDQGTLTADQVVQAGKDIDNAQQNIDSFGEGFNSAFAELAKGFTDFQMAVDATNMVWGHMSSAIDNMVDDGKAGFKDMADSILKDLTKMILKAMLFKYIFAPFGGFLEKSFGLDAGTIVPGKAKGGPVSANTPYMTGEQGVELFVPRTNGTIIPNNQLGGGSAPVTNNYITNNISAMDSRSVAQVFAENRQTLLGTVEYARKETSYGV
jgi:tape measure domain-containing protein